MSQTATAQVVGTYQTSVQLNDRYVVGYDVLIRDAGGEIFNSRFEDDEFNVFPPADFSYARPGESFGVRFLPRFPKEFIILTDDDSP